MCVERRNKSKCLIALLHFGAVTGYFVIPLTKSYQATDSDPAQHLLGGRSRKNDLCILNHRQTIVNKEFRLELPVENYYDVVAQL